MAVINVKIISDVICPFCYLGKKRFETAIDLYKKTVPGAADDRFVVSWLPFYLDPTAPKKGVPIKQRMAEKFGADRVPAMNARMSAAGAAEGINFTHEGKAGNTRDAHRLIQFAKAKAQAARAAAAGGDAAAAVPAEGSDALDAKDPQNAVVHSLFRSYFEEGGDVTSHDMLVAAAARAGLDAAEARAWLDDGEDRGGAEVDAEVEAAYARDVHSVPFFIFNDKVALSGAQEPSTFVQAFQKAKQ